MDSQNYLLFQLFKSMLFLCLFCDTLSLLRDKEKRHKLPDVFEILFHNLLLIFLYLSWDCHLILSVVDA